jgi:hypothetical protein
MDENKNIIQSINDLKMILNYDNIDQSHQLTFCEDSKSQMLYMSCPLKTKIHIWFLRKSNYEECKDEVIVKKDKKKLGLPIPQIMDKVQCTLGKVIVNLNQKLKVMNKDEQKIEKTFCHICDEDHREEYISAKFPPEFKLTESVKRAIMEQGLWISDTGSMVRILDKDKDNYVLLDNGGIKEKVMTYRRESKYSELTQMRLIMH